MCNVVFHIANINVCVWSGSKSLVFIKTREDTTSGIGSTSCASLSSHIRGSHVAAKKPFCFDFALVRCDPELILTFTKMRETFLNKERALNCRRCLFKRNYLVSESAKRCKLSVFSFWPKQLKTTTMINCSLNYRSVRFNTDMFDNDQWVFATANLVFCLVSLFKLHAASTRLAPITSPFILTNERQKYSRLSDYQQLTAKRNYPPNCSRVRETTTSGADPRLQSEVTLLLWL